jgi:hypothetical protein
MAPMPGFCTHGFSLLGDAQTMNCLQNSYIMKEAALLSNRKNLNKHNQHNITPTKTNSY